MKMSFYIRTYVITVIVLIFGGCEDYLDKKPDQSLVVPTTLDELQALLDYDFQNLNQDAALGFMGGDNYYLPYSSWQTLYSNVEKNSYTWAKDIYELEPASDWMKPYEQVFISNVVLEGLGNINSTEHNKEQWQQIRGSALFFRAYAFYNLLQYYAPPYNPETAAAELGIPLRLSSHLDAPVYRENLKVCYDEVIRNLEEAALLLPEETGYKTRPSKAAAYALLARVHLITQNYEQAAAHADSSLALSSNLLIYADYDTTSTHPFEAYNEEVIFHSVSLVYNIYRRALVVPELYNSYQPGDLRKGLYYNYDQQGTFKGWYATSIFSFTGLAVDEIYLIRAECHARLGDVIGAMDDLNTLLRNRWEPDLYVERIAANAEDALQQVLIERRKELAFRGLRWSDLRRLNQDPRFAATIRRDWPDEGISYSLPPNDPRYVYPIPYEEIEISHIKQNIR